MKIPTIDDYIEATEDEIDDSFDRSINNRIAQEIEESREDI